MILTLRLCKKVMCDVCLVLYSIKSTCVAIVRVALSTASFCLILNLKYVCLMCHHFTVEKVI